MKSFRAEWLKYCSCFIAGCLTTHQWFLHQHSTLDIAQGSHAFHSPHAVLTTPISSSEAPGSQSLGRLGPAEDGPSQPTLNVDRVEPVSIPQDISSRIDKAESSASLDSTANAILPPSSNAHLALQTKPSWHRLLDCSVAALPDCFASQGAYAEYPDFIGLDLDTIRLQPKLDAAAKGRQREIDVAVKASLRDDASSAKSAASSSPSASSVTEADTEVLNPGQWACAAASEKSVHNMAAAYDNALGGLASDAAKFPGNHRAAFTMADKNYAHQISEVGVMAKRHGLPVLLFACLDAQCLAAGCRTAAQHNSQPMRSRSRSPLNTQSSSSGCVGTAFRAALIPGSSNSEANTKARVEHGKFWTAWQLAQRGTDFVFFEMDVWLVAPLGHSLFSLHYPSSYASREQLGLRLHQGQLGNKPPLTLVDRDHHARQGVGSGSKSGAAVAVPNLIADLLVSTHQDVPFSMNIGFFSVQGNPKTATFFARLLSKLAADPSLKDQRVFINLCRHPATSEDMWGGVFGLIPPLFVASHVKPWRMPETLAVHVLSNRPLTVPHGKAIVAKELGAWTGAEGYYHEDGAFEEGERGAQETSTEAKEGLREQSQQQQQPSPRRRRYLALDSHALSMNNRDVNHHPTYLRAVLAFLVAVAKATGRVLILPAVFHDAFYVYAWNHLDLKSVEELGVEWRETNFLRTLGHRRQALARRQAASAAAADTADTADTDVGAAEFPVAAAARSSQVKSGVWGKGGLFGRSGSPWDVARVALLDGAIAVAQSSSDPEHTVAALGAPVVREDATESTGKTMPLSGDVNSGPSGWRFHRVPRGSCLGSGLWPLLLDDSTVQAAPLLLLRMPVLDGLSPHHLQGGSSSPLGAPSWVAEVYKRLRWCDADRKGGIFKPKSTSVAMSADDCYERGKEGAWT